MYVEEVTPRRTPLSGKRAIFGWKLIKPDPYEASDLSGAFYIDETVDVHAELGYLSCQRPILFENQVLVNPKIDNGDTPGWIQSRY